jgi:hypothetical protein
LEAFENFTLNFHAIFPVLVTQKHVIIFRRNIPPAKEHQPLSTSAAVTGLQGREGFLLLFVGCHLKLHIRSEFLWLPANHFDQNGKGWDDHGIETQKPATQNEITKRREGWEKNDKRRRCVEALARERSATRKEGGGGLLYLA